MNTRPFVVMLATAAALCVAGCSGSLQTVTAETVANDDLQAAFDHAAGVGIATDEQAHDFLLVLPSFQTADGQGYALDVLRELQGEMSECPQSTDRDRALAALDRYFEAAATASNLLADYTPQSDASTYAAVTDVRNDLRKPPVRSLESDFASVACTEDFLSMTSWTVN